MAGFLVAAVELFGARDTLLAAEHLLPDRDRAPHLLFPGHPADLDLGIGHLREIYVVCA
jgi:hypothetical protein